MDTVNRNEGEEFARFVGEQVRGEAAMRNLSIVGLAQKMNIDRVTLTRYLSGKRSMPLPVLHDAAQALGLTAGLILDRADERMSQEGYTLAASDHDYDAEIEAMQEDP